MKYTSLKYLTKEGCRNIWVNRLMSLASVTVLMSCLVIIGSFVLVFLNISTVLDRVEAQNIVMVFVDDNISADDVSMLGKDIERIENVSSYELVPKEEAYKELLMSMGTDASVLEGVDEDFLPDAYKVTISDMALYNETVESLKGLDNILSVRQNSDLADKLLQIRQSITYISIGIILMLFFVALFIIANTVRITMFSRRLEISIMKAVGATNWFIRWPFLVEGVFLGVLSAFFSIGLLYVIYFVAEKSFEALLGVFESGIIPFSECALQLLGGFLVLGVFTGFFGSLVSMGRYLKEQGRVVKDEK